MSEYWKSTPKYWCKDCKVFVRDTKFERTQHEATGKHQGNIRRSITQLHRNVEREEREKQRTKDELERLNRLVPGGGGPSTVSKHTDSRENGKKPTVVKGPAAVATPEERKRQLAQLAALGVQVPEEFRRENAMIGEWETVAIKPVYDEPEGGQSAVDGGVTNESAQDKKRRTFDDDEAELNGRPVKRVWAPALKKYDYKKGDDDDIETLLGGIKTTPAVKQEDTPDGEEMAQVKKEELVGEGVEERGTSATAGDVKSESLVKDDPLPGAGIVFKKRKPKPK